jgi:hypothetical protein
MSTRFRIELGVEPMEPKVLLSAAGRIHARQHVDITGEFLRIDFNTPPRPVGRTRVYAVQGHGGNASMGNVQVRGTATDTGRGGGHAFKGNLTLTNGRGTVTVKITNGAYRVNGGTGAYRGAVGLGVVTYGVSDSGTLEGMAFSGDH